MTLVIVLVITKVITWMTSELSYPNQDKKLGQKRPFYLTNEMKVTKIQNPLLRTSHYLEPHDWREFVWLPFVKVSYECGGEYQKYFLKFSQIFLGLNIQWREFFGHTDEHLFIFKNSQLWCG